MHNGVPYRYLYATHFPVLRKSEIVFTTISGEDAPDIMEAPQTGVEAATIPSDTVEVCNAVIPHEASAAASMAETGNGYCFALKTNMLYDAALIPNIGVEFPIGRYFSVGGNWMYAWWKSHVRNRHWRIYGGDISARWWLNGGARALNGHHIGVYGTVLLYQVAFGENGYISGIPGQNMTGGKPWTGGGVEYGYSLNVHPRLNIDFSLGVGYAGGEQRVYRMADDCYVWQSSSRKHWFGPTKAEISLVWKIGKLPQTEKSGKEVRQ